MDLRQIRELIKLVDESGLTSLELEEEGFKIVLKKETKKLLIREPASGPPTGGQNISGNYALRSGIGEQVPISEDQPVIKDFLTINSPIVGTFYGSLPPGEEPFVRPGGKVRKGDTLCIIEAMKLMNEIEAEEDLQIMDILVQDGQMVEYGQPLFAIDIVNA